MEHLNEDQLINFWMDRERLSEAAVTHLGDCAQCRQRSAAFEMLRDEFAVARASVPSPAVEAKLMAIFADAALATSPGGPLDTWADRLAMWVKALPRWDSRQQVGALGVRNANRNAYRLLYGAHATEVELMVEAHHGTLRIIGEVMVDDPAAHSGLALIELMTHINAQSAIETESDLHGHFALDAVPPGTYVMTITPRFGQMLVIEPLELT